MTPEPFSSSSSPPEKHETWITAAEAAALLHLSVAKIIRRVEKETLIGHCTDSLPYSYDGKPNYVILLECLPQNCQLQYQINHCSGHYCGLDVVSPREFYGALWEPQFLRRAEVIRQATVIRETYRGMQTVTVKLRQLAEENGISLATLYRILGKPSSKEASLLYLEPGELSRHLPKTMCLWCAELCIALYVGEEFLFSHNAIFRETAALRGKVPCRECVHHPARAPRDETVCSLNREFMLVPNNRRTVNRLLNHVPHQLLCYQKEGVRQWRSKYGMFSLRDKPMLVNDCWQGDHHVFDLFVRIKTRKYVNDRVMEKEIAVRPVLTAWMDSATGCFVGWVISVLPNSDTIAEAFCRAVTFTVGEPFHSLPLKVYTDCGRDFKSSFLTSDMQIQSEDVPEKTDPLNRRFLGLGMLRALGVEVLHALPYHPQSKSIERAFRVIESICAKRITGHLNMIDGAPPTGYYRKIQTLLKEQRLPTMEEFAEIFRTEILAEYHGMTPADDTGADVAFHGEADTDGALTSQHVADISPFEKTVAGAELPGWLLAYESMSPMQRYKQLPKARDVTPGWQLLAILKLHRKGGCKIGKYGIRFRHTWYKHEALAFHVGDQASILYHEVEMHFAPSSVTVIWNDAFLCEAIPAEKMPHTGASPAAIQANADVQNAPAKEMSRLVSKINRNANAILPNYERRRGRTAENCISRKDQLREEVYGPTIDEERICPGTESVNDSNSEDAITAVLNKSREIVEQASGFAADASDEPNGKYMSEKEYNRCLDFLIQPDF